MSYKKYDLPRGTSNPAIKAAVEFCDVVGSTAKQAHLWSQERKSHTYALFQQYVDEVVPKEDKYYFQGIIDRDAKYFYASSHDSE